VLELIPDSDSDSRNAAPDSKPDLDSESRNAVPDLTTDADSDSDPRNAVADSTTEADSDSLTPRSSNYSLKPTTGIVFPQRCWLY